MMGVAGFEPAFPLRAKQMLWTREADAENPRLWGRGFSKTGWTRLELATSGVTGRRSNHLSYHPSGDGGWIMMGVAGFEPAALCV